MVPKEITGFYIFNFKSEEINNKRSEETKNLLTVSCYLHIRLCSTTFHAVARKRFRVCINTYRIHCRFHCRRCFNLLHEPVAFYSSRVYHEVCILRLNRILCPYRILPYLLMCSTQLCTLIENRRYVKFWRLVKKTVFHIYFFLTCCRRVVEFETLHLSV